MRIRYLKHKEIDRTRWDECLDASPDALPYARTWYLDVVSPGWEALVADDYDCIMPLPRKRRYGLAYLVQPPLTQQLGVFARQGGSEKMTEAFMRKIPYWSYHMHLNEHNATPRATPLPNYVLPLARPYAELQAAYGINARRNIAKARRAGVEVREGLPPDDFLTFYYGVEKDYTAPDRALVARLLDEGLRRSAVALYGAYNPEGELVAALCLLVSTGRLVYLLPVSGTEGKRLSAMFAVIDHIIYRNAGTPCLLDFEGSRQEGIARFYRGFGAELREYYGVRRLHP